MGFTCDIEVDGGINENTITMIKDADIAVAGTYIINSDNYYRQIEKLKTISTQKQSLLNIKNKIILAVIIILLIILLIYHLYSKYI